MRRFNRSSLKIETAGQSLHHASSIPLIGIINAQEFRTKILERSAAFQNNHKDSADPLIRIADKLYSIHNLLEKAIQKP